MPLRFPWRRSPPEQSPIPAAAMAVNRLAAEVAKVADQLRRQNDQREGKPQ